MYVLNCEFWGNVQMVNLWQGRVKEKTNADFSLLLSKLLRFYPIISSNSSTKKKLKTPPSWGLNLGLLYVRQCLCLCTIAVDTTKKLM